MNIMIKKNIDSVGKRLKRDIKILNWNQEFLAQLLKLSKTVISQLLNDKLPMTVEIDKRLSKLFMTDIGYWTELDKKYRDNK